MTDIRDAYTAALDAISRAEERQQAYRSYMHDRPDDDFHPPMGVDMAIDIARDQVRQFGVLAAATSDRVVMPSPPAPIERGDLSAVRALRGQVEAVMQAVNYIGSGSALPGA